MAYGNFLLDKGYRAAAAMTKFYAVKFSAAETVTPVTANTDLIAGFVQFGVTSNEITRGKGASVRTDGISEAVATGAITVGQQVQLESDGRVSALVGSSGKRIVGRCVGHASTNAGDRIALRVTINGGVA
jgi:hypothetical protein